MAEPTHELHSETSETDRQTYSLFRESSSVALQTLTDLEGLEVMVRRLAAQEHSVCARSAGVAHLCKHEVWCRR